MASTLRVMVLGAAAAAEELMPRLRVAGYAPECRVVATEKAFRAGLKTTPDVILATGTLAGLDALSALQYLRRRELDIPVIVLASQGNRKVASDVAQLGGVHFLNPDQLHGLGQVVRTVLEQRRTRPRDTPPTARTSSSRT